MNKQIDDFIKLQGSDCPEDVKQLADSIQKKMKGIEAEITQTKAKAGVDLLQYPGKLLNKLAGVYASCESQTGAPSQQIVDAYAKLKPLCQKPIDEFNALQENELKALNVLIRDKSLPVIKMIPKG